MKYIWNFPCSSDSKSVLTFSLASVAVDLLAILHFFTKQKFQNISCSLNYKNIIIVNDDSCVINKLRASLNDAARVVIYDHHMFIVQASGMILPPGVRE
jgi:hypothetical protein